jgi:peptidyl-prolyl cis-trans isomerase C
MALRYVIPAFVLAAVLGGIGYTAYAENAPAPAATPVAAQVAPAPAASPKVAEVGGEAITKADVEQLYNAIKQRAGAGAPPVDQIFWMLADQIIASRLIIKEAAAQNLENSEEVQSSLKMAREQILQEAYVRKLFEGIDSDAALQPRYQQLADSFKTQQEVHARHILVENEEEAKALIAKLAAGGDFAQLAKESSKDPGSKDNGGDLGFFAQDAMVPEFAAAAFALEPGKVSQTPVHTQFGWHVIKVEERRPRQAPSFEEAKPELVSQAQQEKLEQTIESLRLKANVQRFNAAGVPPMPVEAPAPAAGAAPAAEAPAATPAPAAAQ